MSSRKNGAQIAQQLVERASDWLKTSPEIPVKTDGSPNVTEIAKQLGTDRKRFSSNDRLKSVINQYLDAKGIRRIGERGRNVVTDANDKAYSELKRENKRLNDRIVAIQAALKDAEYVNKKLTEKLLTLEEKLEEETFDADMLMSFGRYPR